VRPARTLVVAAAVGTLLGAGTAACFDVLHDTADLRTACELDASTPGCPNADRVVGVCAPSRDGARASAEHACAWLSACESPVGDNAIGPCMFAARTAFDCEANPQHRVQGKQAALWSCLAAARRCADVDACVFPAGVQGCGARDADVCGSSTPSSGSDNGDVRIECPAAADAGSRAGAENCALWGRTCAAGACAPTRTPGCSANVCSGSAIDWCEGDDDVGIDCPGPGPHRCSGFPTASAAYWLACIPEYDGGATCPPEAAAVCSSGEARSCPAGVPETIDCAALLGVSADGGGCNPGPLSPPFDWTSPCAVVPPSCTADACDGGVASGCARGTVFSVDCAQAGLGSCAMRAVDLGQQHAACTPPPDP
jgi:hypothetical protein